MLRLPLCAPIRVWGRERILPQCCCYCATRSALSVDHLLPRSKGGSHDGDNMVWACKSCNSSKGNKDVLLWLSERNRFAPILLLRRYLKLALEFSLEHGLLDTPLVQARTMDLPFSVDAIPHRYPGPAELALWVVPFE